MEPIFSEWMEIFKLDQVMLNSRMSGMGLCGILLSHSSQSEVLGTLELI